MTMKRAVNAVILWSLLSLPLLLVARNSAADDNSPLPDHSAVLAPYVSDDTFFVSYVDMASLAAPEDSSALIPLMFRLPKETQDKMLGIMIVGGLASRFQEAGGQGLYTLMGLEDFNAVGGPVLLATAAPGKNLAGVEQLIHDVIQEVSADSSQVALLPVAPKLKARHAADVVLIGTESVVARYESRHRTTRGDLVEPLAKLTNDGAAVAAVFSPGPDFRRVVRELWPELPPPLAPLRGALADRWLRLEFEAKTQAAAQLQAAPSVQLTLQATDREAAELFVQVLRALPEASEQFDELGKRRHELGRMLQTMIDAIPARVDGSRVVMSLPTDETQIAKLRGLASEAGDAAMERVRSEERLVQFKQLALALHNYHDKNKHLPAAAIRDSNGRPLLSWRVAILPYVEEGDLYKQFHLDEPWDSPHNSTLIERMPDVYTDPSGKIRRLAGDGKTTFVVPVGPGTVFDRLQGTTFKEITDGTSMTVMIVEVPPQQAVVWSRPEDWEVDPQQPWDGLRRTDRDYITAAWCDGRGSLIPIDTDPAKFLTILTRAGGEVVDWP